MFDRPGAGFDAIVGNPLWETVKPNSKEFFSNIDPLYRTYGKQEALRRQSEYFASDPQVEHDWLAYCAKLRALAHFTRQAASPFGDGADDGDRFTLVRGSENQRLHARWQQRRSTREGYAEPAHPFRHQGIGDVNTYKLFLEQAHALLRPGGRLGFLVPSGIYTDKGSTELRTLFLSACRWEWLFGFENREGIFDIHRSFKFCPVIVQKGGSTAAVRTAFMHRDLDDWAEGERHAIPYARAQVERFSPKSKAILEIRSQRDLEVIERIYAHSVLLGDDGPDGWGIRYACEFHMTNDSKLFPPRPEWEAKGYWPDPYGRWIGPDGDIALPLYEGRMIGQFDFSQKGWVSGKGRGAVWREIPWEEKVIEPQYLMAQETFLARAGGPLLKAVMMDVTSATNTRTMIAGPLGAVPCCHKAPTLVPTRGGPFAAAAVVAVVNSLVFDAALRLRLGGQSLIWAVLAESPIGAHLTEQQGLLALAAARLALVHATFAPHWGCLRHTGAVPPLAPWRRLWAITPHERLRLRCMLDAIVAELYGLDWDDFAWILRDCDHPVARSTDNAFTRTLDPKGFWRVDKDQDPELRHTVLSLVAFRDLKEMIGAHAGDRDAGIEAFCAQHDGDGWMLPETLRLADYGLGHDDRAQHPQPVAARLGPRFLPWQLEQSVEESWAECEQHARNILGESGLKQLMAELSGQPASSPPPDAPNRPTDLFGDSVPTDLFGTPLEPKPRRRRRR